MRVTLLSDAHFREPAEAAQVEFVELLSAHRSEIWVFVGDFFDAWWGTPGVLPSGAFPALAAIRARVGCGDQVYMIPGNRDFHRLELLEAPLGVRVCDPWRGESGGRSLIAYHGHQAWRPRGQQVLEAALRNSLLIPVIDAVGSARVQRVASAIAARRRERRRAPLAPILAAQTEYARKQSEELVFSGHTHAPGLLDLGGGRAWINLGDWTDHRSLAVVEDGVVTLARWARGALTPIEGPPARRL